MLLARLLYLPYDVAEAWQQPWLVNLVLFAAITANAVLILAPYQSALRAANGDVSATELVGLLAPTFALFAQSYLWACYGMVLGQLHIFHFNAWGACMCLIYLAIMAHGSRKLPMLRTMLTVCIGFIAMFSISVALAPSTVIDRQRVFSYAAIVFSTLQSLAPMNQALEALQTRSAAKFPFMLTVSSGWTSLLWAQYAAMMHDDIYFLANALGVSLSVLEVAVAGWVMLVAPEDDGYKQAVQHIFHDASDLDSQPLMPVWRKFNFGKKSTKVTLDAEYGSLAGKGMSHQEQVTMTMQQPPSVLAPWQAQELQMHHPVATHIPTKTSKSLEAPNLKSAFSAIRKDDTESAQDCDSDAPCSPNADPIATKLPARGPIGHSMNVACFLMGQQDVEDGPAGRRAMPNFVL